MRGLVGVSVLLVLDVWGAVAFGGPGGYRQLQRIWATEPERIAAAIGFMAVNPSGMAYGERDFKAWRELGRNRKGEVWFRPGSGAYSDTDPLGSGGIVAKNLQIARLVAATEGPGVVNVAEEVTCPCDRKTKSMRLTFFECALNVGLVRRSARACRSPFAMKVSVRRLTRSTARSFRRVSTRRRASGFRYGSRRTAANASPSSGTWAPMRSSARSWRWMGAREAK